MSGFVPEIVPGEQDTAATRRDVLWAFIRALMNAVVLLAMYYLLPLDEPFGRTAVGWLLVGLVCFIGLVSLQVGLILRDPHPGMRAVATAGATIPAFVLLYASTYLLVNAAQAQAFTEPLDHTDALYFAMTIFSTVGFGDIAPRSEAARVLVTAQMVGNLVVLGLLARVIVGAVKLGREWRSDTRTDATDPPSG